MRHLSRETIAFKLSSTKDSKYLHTFLFTHQRQRKRNLFLMAVSVTTNSFHFLTFIHMIDITEKLLMSLLYA